MISTQLGALEARRQRAEGVARRRRGERPLEGALGLVRRVAAAAAVEHADDVADGDAPQFELGVLHGLALACVEIIVASTSTPSSRRLLDSTQTLALHLV